MIAYNIINSNEIEEKTIKNFNFTFTSWCILTNERKPMQFLLPNLFADSL